jgi:hypothetical protein
VFLLGTWWSYPSEPLWQQTSDLINKAFGQIGFAHQHCGWARI